MYCREPDLAGIVQQWLVIRDYSEEKRLGALVQHRVCQRLSNAEFLRDKRWGAGVMCVWVGGTEPSEGIVRKGRGQWLERAMTTGPSYWTWGARLHGNCVLWAERWERKGGSSGCTHTRMPPGSTIHPCQKDKGSLSVCRIHRFRTDLPEETAMLCACSKGAITKPHGCSRALWERYGAMATAKNFLSDVLYHFIYAGEALWDKTSPFQV